MQMHIYSWPYIGTVACNINPQIHRLTECDGYADIYGETKGKHIYILSSCRWVFVLLFG